MKKTQKIIGLLIFCIAWMNVVYGQTPCPTCPTGSIDSYLESDQKDDTYCNTPVNVKLKLIFPPGFNIDPTVDPVFSNGAGDFNWTIGPGSGVVSPNNSTLSITTSVINGNINLVIGPNATVTFNVYRLCSPSGIYPYTSIQCTMTLNSPNDLTILNGNNLPPQQAYTPKHYWTFETELNEININNTLYSIPSFPSSPICPGQRVAQPYFAHRADLMTVNCTTNPMLANTEHCMLFATGGNFIPIPGRVGQCADVEDNKLTAQVFLTGQKEISQEFLIRFHEDFSAMSITKNRAYFFFEIGSKKIDFGVTVDDGSGALINEHKVIYLDGIDRKDWNYYMDDEWHHIAMTADLNTGTAKLYIDGICPKEFTHRYIPRPNDEINFNGYYTIGANGTYGWEEFGLMDEWAIYEDVLSATMVYKHYDNAISNGDHYNFSDDVIYCNSPVAVNSCIIPAFIEKEYPNGYTANGPTASGASAANIAQPIDQIKSAPFPRYLPGNSLLRNFPWFDYAALGGNGTDPGANVRLNAGELNNELASHWNYMVPVGIGNGTDFIDVRQFANNHPEIPSCLRTYWSSPSPLDQTLNSDYYMLNNLGNSHGALQANGSTYKIWGIDAPLGPVDGDGQNANNLINLSLRGLQRPLDLINENGEVYPGIGHWSETAINNGYNAGVVDDFSTSGLGWIDYAGRKKTAIRNAYRDGFLDRNPLLKDRTKFSYYAVDGKGGHLMNATIEPSYAYMFGPWSEIKQVQKNFAGNNYYSTPDYYPLSPYWWAESSGADHGVDWIRFARHGELLDGDRLFSPYVCAGWNETPTRNIRPGQWLGMMKAFGVLGAEFYYTAYFPAVDHRFDAIGNPVYKKNGTGGLYINPATGKPVQEYIFQNPKHWAWQTLVPSYAQAITSRYENILREGDLLIDPDLTDPEQKQHFGLKGGGLNVYTVAKRWINPNNHSDIQYVISTTNQTFHNTVMPQEKMINLLAFDAGNNSAVGTLTIETRRQGSTYILKNDEINFTEPVFIQLDGWHQWEHPDRWDEDYVFEAEVPDEVVQFTSNVQDIESMMVRTKIVDPNNGNETTPPAINQDYTNFVSYYTFPNYTPVGVTTPVNNWGINGSAPKLTYKFRVSEDPVNGLPNYRLYVRARRKGPIGSNKTGINVNLVSEDRTTQLYADYLGCIDDSEWKWYSYGLCQQIDFVQLEAGYYLLDLIPENEAVEIDKIILDEGLNIILPQNELITYSCGDPAPNGGAPYDAELGFTYDKSCLGQVNFTSNVWPVLDPSCYSDPFEYEWTVIGVNGTVFNKEITGFGSGTYTGGSPFFSGTFENPTFDFPGPGEYQVTLNVNVNLTPYSTNQTITIYDIPSVVAFPSKTNICDGEEVLLTANASGGSGGYEYAWYPSLTTLTPNDPSGTTVAYPNSDRNEIYSVTVTDMNGCEAEATFNLSMKDPLCVDITYSGSPVTNLCYGLNSQTLRADVCVTGCVTGCGTPAAGSLNYVWDGHQLPVKTGQSVNIFNSEGIESGRYNVTVTDIDGCTGEAFVDVIVDPSTIVVNPNGTNNAHKVAGSPFCQGTTGAINLSTAVATPSGTYTYTWSEEALGANGPTSLNSNTGTSVSAGATGTEMFPTLYTVTAKDADGCTGKGYVWLDITDGIRATVSPTTDLNCIGSPQNVLMSAGISGTTAGTPSYSWSPTINLTPTNPTAMTYTPPAVASVITYTVRILDGSGPCYSEASAVFEVAACKKGNDVPKSEESTSIEKEVTEKGSVILFPNPNNGTFQLRFTGELENEVLNVVVLDLQGKVITQKVKTENELLNFEMKDLPRGVYFIRLFNDNYNLRVSTVID